MGVWSLLSSWKLTLQWSPFPPTMLSIVDHLPRSLSQRPRSVVHMSSREWSVPLRRAFLESSDGKQMVFLTGSDITRNGNVLTALPTRDAFLPLLCALFAAHNRKTTLPKVFDTLPPRFSRASLLRNFPRPTSMKIVERFSPPEASMQDVSYQSDGVTASDADQANVPVSEG